MTAVSTAAVIAVCDSTRSPCVVAVIMNSVPPSAPPTAHAIACLPGVSTVRSTWPHSLVAQRAVRSQIEDGDALPPALRDQKRRVVGGDHHAVGHPQTVGHLVRRTVGINP